MNFQFLQRRGQVGGVGYPAFVSDSADPTLDQFIDPTDYNIQLVGIGHIGIGVDYDEIRKEMPNLTKRFLERVRESGDVKKNPEKNWMQVFRAVQNE
jgi:microsomal dipeptidase-like Zn-dependent dipeptidase